MNVRHAKQEKADGILDNGCFQRFNVIFDYTHNRLQLKPNLTFGTQFDS